MTARKRLRVILAALRQEWHQKTCCECGFTWMAVGPYREELIDTCDACEAAQLDRMAEFHEREYQRLKAEGVIK